jgi:deoxyribose-phosphate aldolase
MRENLSEIVQVKAAGGIRTLPALLEAIDTGITRCGATATAAILDDFKARQSGQQPESRPDPTPGAY